MFQITERVKFNPARQTFQAAKKFFSLNLRPKGVAKKITFSSDADG